MPVVVTGAGSPLGRAVVATLRADGVEVRAAVADRSQRPALAALGVPVAVTDLSDGRTAGAVLEGAHTVVHLADPLDTWVWLLDAAVGTSVRRVVLVLPPGVPPPAPPASEAGAGPEVVVVRGSVERADPAVVDAVVAADARR